MYYPNILFVPRAVCAIPSGVHPDGLPGSSSGLGRMVLSHAAAVRIRLSVPVVGVTTLNGPVGTRPRKKRGTMDLWRKWKRVGVTYRRF
jgi:hypothetical protein